MLWEEFGVIIEIIENIAIQEYPLTVCKFCTEFMPFNLIVTFLPFGQEEFDFSSVDLEIIVRAELNGDSFLSIDLR